MLVSSYSQLGRRELAYQVCQQGLQLFRQDLELRFREAGLLHDFGRIPEAVQSYRAVLKNNEPPHFASVERGIKGYLTRHNLAVAYAEMGHWHMAEAEWRLALEEMPTFQPALEGLKICSRKRVRAVAERQAGSSSLRSPSALSTLNIRVPLALPVPDRQVARRLALAKPVAPNPKIKS